tara:strand:+ start:3137 stop:3721 length:585 start_codon:yes stop_codon:yes gene_type:complete
MVSFKTTYDDDGNPIRPKISSNMSFKTGDVVSADPNNPDMTIIERKGEGIMSVDPRQESGDNDQIKALEIINNLGTGIFDDPDAFKKITEPLKMIPANTTDPNDPRNMYQMLIANLLGIDRGAKSLDIPGSSLQMPNFGEAGKEFAVNELGAKDIGQFMSALFTPSILRFIGMANEKDEPEETEEEKKRFFFFD